MIVSCWNQYTEWIEWQMGMNEYKREQRARLCVSEWVSVCVCCCCCCASVVIVSEIAYICEFHTDNFFSAFTYSSIKCKVTLGRQNQYYVRFSFVAHTNLCIIANSCNFTSNISFLLFPTTQFDGKVWGYVAANQVFDACVPPYNK